MPGLFRMYVTDILAHVHPRDRDYFRASREKMIGTTLEAYAADRDARLAPFRDSLAPLRATLGRQPFLAGDAPARPTTPPSAPSMGPFGQPLPGDRGRRQDLDLARAPARRLRRRQARKFLAYPG